MRANWKIRKNSGDGKSPARKQRNWQWAVRHEINGATEAGQLLTGEDCVHFKSGTGNVSDD
jgi:hypothetical protein